ncbi:MAG: zinc dependent phospholipase C family protein [Candidatus Latescibacteria bacterium]|nr:zinc dependent phospholipase C family protein [Candidatus Latescibacterota bacterium]MBT4136946.1 zinc dependent phospholipase C family protein [Candidatus Latescibacterota bacterium]MBT5828777.1 zinc dependent phospholipase C family protein [Candidatus Latescibacterota bacterium]
MPRGRCHFALLVGLQERLDEDLPQIGELTKRHFSDFLAGSLAPDAMRSLGKMGKFGSHFYSEDRQETWGKSVVGLFESHPNLSNPEQLSEQDCAFLMGYISHLTTDEAFRDQVTIHVHGVDLWRPIIRGLWSLVDELPINHPNLGGEVDLFVRSDHVGFIDCQIVRTFLQRARGWAVCSNPWEHELVFLQMIEREIPEQEARESFTKNRGMAARYLNENRRRDFVDEAIQRGFDAVRGFMTGKHKHVRVEK